MCHKLVPSKARKGCWVPWNWSDGCLCTTVWVLRTGLGSPERAALTPEPSLQAPEAGSDVAWADPWVAEADLELWIACLHCPSRFSRVPTPCQAPCRVPKEPRALQDQSLLLSCCLWSGGSSHLGYPASVSLPTGALPISTVSCRPLAQNFINPTLQSLPSPHTLASDT